LAVPVAESMFASAVSPSPAGWTTEFSDNFSGAAGSGPDSAWTDDIGTQYHGTGCQGNWATGETETDTNSTANVSEDGSGPLNITPVDTNGAWTSGRIETVPEFTPPAGGLMEVTASIRQPDLANGAGYWAAFWMLGAGYRVSGAGTSGTMNCLAWPSVGEINVMEDVNAQSQVSGTLHCGTTPGGPCNEGDGLTSGLQPCPGCQQLLGDHQPHQPR
jgi:beta-glucanase (GH16 family)